MDRILTPEEAFAPSVPPLTIELTSRCNLKCPYCANPTLKREYGEMPTELIYRLADECAREGLEVMAVHGIGEPLLRKDLDAILARFTELGIWKGWLTTNGTLLSTRRLEALVAAGLKGLSISIDTLDAELYGRTRGGKLAKVISNVQAGAHLFPDLLFVVWLMNHREQTVDQAIVDSFYDHFRGLKNVRHDVYENGRFPGAAEDWRPSSWLTDGCSSWASHFTIAIDGRVSICCADQEVEHVIGDVSRQSIKDVWLSATSQDAFRSITLGLSGCPQVCYKCQLKPTTRVLHDVDPMFYAPYLAVRRAVQAALDRGNDRRALELLRQLKKRSPWDAEMSTEIEALSQRIASRKEKIARYH